VSLAAVDQILHRRARRAGRRPEAVSLAAAALLHAAAVALILLLPRLAPPPPPLAFVPVQIIPAQALGVRRPASRPKAEKPAPPEPEPAKPAPEEPEPPAPQPQEDAPVLPPEKPEKKKPEPKPPAERSTGANAGAAVPQPNPGDEAGRRGAPDASPAGTSAFGPKVGGLDNPDFRFGYYIDQLLSAIDAKWLRPPLGDEVKAIVSFRIERDGSITDLEVAESSGYNSFDLAALRAVQNAAPFPPLPRAYRHDSLGVNLIVQ
jgi:periplasmic protein TonB